MAQLDEERLKQVIEAALLSAGRPLSISDFERLFSGDPEPPARDRIRGALAALADDWAGGSLALHEVASGFRAQVRHEFEPWIARLWEEKPPRYSRALLETLAIIAYRQPITRSEIEEIRGVSVSTQIMRTLHEREWVRIVGHRESPGKPAMYGTTRQFLDYFNLKTLDQLPPLSEVRELDARYPELAFEGEPSGNPGGTNEAGASETGPAPQEAHGPAANERGKQAGHANASVEEAESSLLVVAGSADAPTDGDDSAPGPGDDFRSSTPFADATPRPEDQAEEAPDPTGPHSPVEPDDHLGAVADDARNADVPEDHSAPGDLEDEQGTSSDRSTREEH